jgi:hypothetical protein
MLKTKTKSSTAVRWTDEQRYTFSDVVELSGHIAGLIHGLVIRRQWEPMFEQAHGGPSVRKTYTARDILRLQATAAALAVNAQLPFGARCGAFQDTLNALQAALDHVIDVAADLGSAPPRTYFCPRAKSPWCKVSFDLQMLVDEQLERLREYKSKP